MCAGRRLWAPLQGLPPAGGTYLDPLLRLRKSRLGGRLRLQRLKSFQTQSGTSHLRSPACTRALGRRDEDGRHRRRRRRSALPAPSRPPSLPSLVRPAPAPRRSRRREARCRRTPRLLFPAPPGLRRAPSPRRERARRRRELPLSPPSLASPPPPGGRVSATD